MHIFISYDLILFFVPLTNNKCFYTIKCFPFSTNLPRHFLLCFVLFQGPWPGLFWYQKNAHSLNSIFPNNRFRKFLHSQNEVFFDLFIELLLSFGESKYGYIIEKVWPHWGYFAIDVLQRRAWKDLQTRNIKYSLFLI